VREPDREGARSLEGDRQRTIDALCEHFANDALDVKEFERRVDVANRAADLDDLKKLLADLPQAQVPAKASRKGPVAAPRPEPATVPAERVPERQLVVGILGGGARKGSWVPARHNYGIAMMGGVELDFREARLGAGVTDVMVFAVWGGVEIVVPPHVHVESNGIGILGGFGQTGHSQVTTDPDAPMIRVKGVSFMGGVEVSVRYPGETAGDARRRRRLERKEQRKRLKRGE
jgi:hypothetical protein